MTDSPITASPAGPIEAKTKAGAIATYAAAFVLFAVLSATGANLTFLPGWLSTILLPLIPTAVGFLASWLKSHQPGQLSASALRAARGSATL